MHLRIETEFDDATKVRDVIITEGEEELAWSLVTYNKSNFQDIPHFYDNLNGFLSQKDPAKVRVMFKCYKNIHNAIHTVADRVRLHEFMRSQVRIFYDALTFDELRRWCLVHGNVVVPLEIKRHYEGEVVNQRMIDRTYLREDYFDLVVYSMLLKLMLPVFAVYMRTIKDEVFSSFKEHFVFSLLKDSMMVDIEPFHRFVKHVEASLDGDYASKTASAVVEGLGTSELPDWVLSKSIIRRLSVTEESVGNNIVANVFHAIGNQLGGMDRTFKGIIRNKELYTSSSGEDNISVAENYKIKETISSGDISVFLAYASDPVRLALRIDPTLDQGLLQECLNLVENNSRYAVPKHTIVLVQWVLESVLSPKSIEGLNKPVLIKVIGVTKALLIHWGFYELALLMICEPTSQSSSITTTGSSRLSKKHVDDLVAAYPYYQNKNNKEDQKDREVNVGIKGINALTSLITRYDWQYRTLPVVAKKLYLKNSEGIHIVSAEIKALQTELLFKIHQFSGSQI